MTAVTPTTSSAIFTKTVNIYPGDYVYLFSEYDGSAYTDESFLGGSACTVSVALGAKRRPVSIPVGNGPYVVDTYEFDSCIMVATENEKANAAYFQVAPNPFTGSARVSFSNEANSTFGLTMTDVAGKTVRSMNGLSGNSVVIEQGTLITGVYFVTLTTANGARFTQKLILQ